MYSWLTKQEDPKHLQRSKSSTSVFSAQVNELGDGWFSLVFRIHSTKKKTNFFTFEKKGRKFKLRRNSIGLGDFPSNSVLNFGERPKNHWNQEENIPLCPSGMFFSLKRWWSSRGVGGSGRIIDSIYMRDVHGGTFEMFMPNAGLRKPCKNDRGLTKLPMIIAANNKFRWHLIWGESNTSNMCVCVCVSSGLYFNPKHVEQNVSFQRFFTVFLVEFELGGFWS